MAVSYTNDLLKNVHEDLDVPNKGETFLVRGQYEYWHYGCDGFNDKGWGCGYRTLQTLCSWVINNENLKETIPSIDTIQETLVKVEDKDDTFIGSKEWIGSFEVTIVLNKLYDIFSKIIHVPNGKQLLCQVDNIKRHFKRFGSPIMMGGNKDCSSKCIVGIHIAERSIHLLIVDPHFVGRAKNVEHLRSNHWVKWQSLDDFVDSSFYNLCLPQLKHHTL